MRYALLLSRIGPPRMTLGLLLLRGAVAGQAETAA
jgi:hypothetical protein